MFSLFGRESNSFSLPLFPLRTVLFPGGLLPLKVFEQRYIDMVKACIKDGAPFGVVLITRGDEVATSPSDPPEFVRIGTLARIVDWEMPQLGILHVMTTGGDRFQVKRHAVEASSLVVADATKIEAEATSALPDDCAPLAKLLEAIAARIGPQNFPAERRFDDASWVGYRLAELLPLPLTVKQSMLEINDALVRLTTLRRFLVDQGLI
jgi:Lon protease-like protein